MIELVAHDGLLCPAFVCDSCREQVAVYGNIIFRGRWATRWQEERTPLRVAHKGWCTHDVEAALATEYPKADGWSPKWRELDDFVKQLAYNTENPFDPEREAGRTP